VVGPELELELEQGIVIVLELDAMVIYISQSQGPIEPELDP
jgi:hypothetical protein